MNAPAVSVILPTHNRAAVLARAIRSVLAQTFPDLELLVIDDGSTDNSAEVVARFDDPRLRYLPCKHHGSAAIARNFGIAESRAPLIAFQDSDDEWLVDKLARQVQAMHSSQLDPVLVCGGYIVRSANGKLAWLGAHPRMQKGDWAADNLYDFWFIAPTWLVKREALDAVGQFDRAMPNLEDWELAFRLFRYGRILALDQPLVLKHGGLNGLNDRLQPRITSLQRIIEKHADIWQTQPGVMAKFYEELGRLRCRQGETADGREDIRRALRLDPGSASRWLAWLASLCGDTGYLWLRSLWTKRRQTP